jgi:hypothetical protein
LVRQLYYTGAGRRRLRFSFLLIAGLALAFELVGDAIASPCALCKGSGGAEGP